MDTLKIFQSISLFVKELNETFGKGHHPLALYNRLLEKTPVTNTLAIQKQVSIFYDFCKRNKEGILGKNKEQIQEKIIFSKKIYIDIKDILKKSDPETEDIIWRHMLLISFHMFQTDDIREIIKNLSSSSDETKSEQDFISTFMTKIETQFKDKQFTDPMTATTELLQSGLFTEMVSTMNTQIQSGNLNIAKLLGSVQGMMGNISGEISSSAQGSNLINNMMSNMMGMMGEMGGVSVEDELKKIEEAKDEEN
jgi:hypothetical protein